jgi:hypothetical protein
MKKARRDNWRAFLLAVYAGINGIASSALWDIR